MKKLQQIIKQSKWWKRYFVGWKHSSHISSNFCWVKDIRWVQRWSSARRSIICSFLAPCYGILRIGWRRSRCKRHPSKLKRNVVNDFFLRHALIRLVSWKFIMIRRVISSLVGVCAACALSSHWGADFDMTYNLREDKIMSWELCGGGSVGFLRGNLWNSVDGYNRSFCQRFVRQPAVRQISLERWYLVYNHADVMTILTNRNFLGYIIASPSHLLDPGKSRPESLDRFDLEWLSNFFEHPTLWPISSALSYCVIYISWTFSAVSSSISDSLKCDNSLPVRAIPWHFRWHFSLV